MKKAKFKCVAYCRVSKKSSRKRFDKEGNEIIATSNNEPSIQNQIDSIKTFVKLHDDFELVAEPFYEVKSGSSSRNRTAFQEALKWLNEGIHGCNAIIVYMKDRIARNYQDYISTLWMVKSQGGYIFSIESSSTDDPICVTHNLDDNSGQDGLLSIIQDTFDAYAYQAYLDSLSKRSIGRNEKRIFEKKRIFLSGFPRFGYKLVKANGNEKEHYEIVEKEAEIIRLIFRLYVEEKYGYNRIAKYLNNKGLTYRRNVRGKEVQQRFTLSSVSYVLRFPGYATGEATFFATENILRRKPIANKLHERFDKKYKRISDIPQKELEDFLQKNAPDYRDTVIKDVYPIIIDAETYKKYLEISSTRESFAKTPNDPNDSGWLSGILYCECGAKMYGKGHRICVHKRPARKNGDSSPDTCLNVYECSARKNYERLKKNDPKPCTSPNKTITYRVDEVVLHFVKTIINNGQFKKYCALGAQKRYKKTDTNLPSIDARLDNLKNEYKKLTNELKALNLSYAQGVYDNPEGLGLPTEKDYKKETNAIKREINRIVSSITSLTSEKEDAEERLNDLDKVERDIDEWVENDPSGLLKTLLYKVIVIKREKFNIWLYFNFLPKAYNPIILVWDGKKSGMDRIEAAINDRLQHDLRIKVK